MGGLSKPADRATLAKSQRTLVGGFRRRRPGQRLEGRARRSATFGERARPAARWDSLIVLIDSIFILSLSPKIFFYVGLPAFYFVFAFFMDFSRGVCCRALAAGILCGCAY